MYYFAVFYILFVYCKNIIAVYCKHNLVFRWFDHSDITTGKCCVPFIFNCVVTKGWQSWWVDWVSCCPVICQLLLKMSSVNTDFDETWHEQCLGQARVAGGGIVFSTCSIIHPFVRPLSNLWTRH